MHAYADMYMYMYIPYGLYIPKDMNNTESRTYSHVVCFPGYHTLDDGIFTIGMITFVS